MIKPSPKILALTKKELSWYFNGPVGYIILSLLLVFANFIFFKDFFIRGEADLRSFFAILPWLLLFFIAGITMRSFSEEKRTGTFELLLSLPLSELEIVTGKFFASCLFVLTAFALSLTTPLTLFLLGKPDLGNIISGYLGLLLFSSALIAIGIFVSSLTKNQVVALLTSTLIFFVLLALGDGLITEQLPKPISSLLSLVSLRYHLESFSRGVVDLRDVVFFLTLSLSFLFLAIKTTENRD